MSGKKSKHMSKPITSATLFGAESVEEEVKSLQETKSPVKRRTKAEMAISLMGESVTDFIRIFLEEHKLNGADLDTVIENWQSEENTERLSSMIKLRLPEPVVKKARKPKDPNAPKRNKSAYIFFGMDKREEVKKKYPGIKVTEISVKLGEMWKKISASTKKKYEDLSLKDKERYVSEMKLYKPDSFKEKGPKRNLSAYFFFCAEKRDEVKESNPDFKVTDIARELGRMWREDYADDESRTEWVRLAVEDKERYAIALKEWQNEHPELVKVPKKKVKKEEEKSKGVPSRNVSTKSVKSTPVKGHALFIQTAQKEIREDYPDWDLKQITTEIKKRWKSLSQEEKKEYD